MSNPKPMKFKHCLECKGCYGHHYPGCSCAAPGVDYRTRGEVYADTIKALAAEIAGLKDEVENLNGELMFRPTYSKLTERIAELEGVLRSSKVLNNRSEFDPNFDYAISQDSVDKAVKEVSG